MPLNIRKAEARDAEELGKLGAELTRTHYAFDSKRFLPPFPGIEKGYANFLARAIDSPEDCVFVAELDGRIVGYVFAALEPMSWMELRGPAGFIHDVLVLDDARGQGIGSKLMHEAIEWLRSHGAPRVILWTAVANTAAHDLFHRLGFRDTMTEMTMDL